MTPRESLIGKPLARVDGVAKVTGAAQYTADVPIPNLKYGVFLLSRIANGRIRSLDTSRAEALPGVVGVLTHQNAPQHGIHTQFPAAGQGGPKNGPSTDSPLYTFPRGPAGETVIPLATDQVYYWGQHIGLVVADTLEVAQQAAWLVEVEYEELPPVLMDNLLEQGIEPTELPAFLEEMNAGRGDVDAGFAAAAVELTQRYRTPSIHHVPMENGSTTAVWDQDQLTLYDSTQTVRGTRNAVSRFLHIPLESVRVVSHYVGGGFGGKTMVWTHVPMTAIAAKHFKVPVKTVLSRAEMFTSMGYRPQSEQVLRLGATKDGRLLAISHDAANQTSIADDYAPPITHMTKTLYACPNIRSRQRLYKVNAGTPTIMRAPGEGLGLFALESAMDELAEKLHLDPLELRLRNHADTDPVSGLSWSSKALRACYAQGAARFGWDRRNPRPGVTREGDLLVGMGMASAMYPVYMSPAAATAKLFADGRALVQSATHEIGQGVSTIMTQIAADVLGLPVAHVTFQLGDTNLPPAPIAGASRTSASVGPAVHAACTALVEDLIGRAVADAHSPLYQCPPTEVAAGGGRLSVRAEPWRGETFAALLARQGLNEVQAHREAFPPDGEQKHFDSMAAGVTTNLGPVTSQHAMYSFGVHFVEVKVDLAVGRVEVSRVVAVYDAGRILNHRTATAQAMGGIVFGIGMALKEQTKADRNRGCLYTASQLDYHVPGVIDAPKFDISFIEETDTYVNTLGVKSMGEIGTAGTAGAIANAVYHATGIRPLQLPINLLQPQPVL